MAMVRSKNNLARRQAAGPGWLRPYAALSAFDYRPRNQYIEGDKAAPGAADGKGWATWFD
jgi:hypothetical protein